METPAENPVPFPPTPDTTPAPPRPKLAEPLVAERPPAAAVGARDDVSDSGEDNGVSCDGNDSEEAGATASSANPVPRKSHRSSSRK